MYLNGFRASVGIESYKSNRGCIHLDESTTTLVWAKQGVVSAFCCTSWVTLAVKIPSLGDELKFLVSLERLSLQSNRLRSLESGDEIESSERL